MEWKEISSEETLSASNAPTIIDETLYSSLYVELKKKCNPKRFMIPYDESKVKIANELYSEIMKLSTKDEVQLIEIRERAIQKLGIYFSTKHLYQPLCEKCNPTNFMNPYDAEKVEIANKLYASVIKQAYNIETLEAIQASAEQLLGIKIECRQEIVDDTHKSWDGIFVLILLGIITIALGLNYYYN